MSGSDHMISFADVRRSSSRTRASTRGENPNRSASSSDLWRDQRRNATASRGVARPRGASSSLYGDASVIARSRSASSPYPQPRGSSRSARVISLTREPGRSSRPQRKQSFGAQDPSSYEAFEAGSLEQSRERLITEERPEGSLAKLRNKWAKRRRAHSKAKADREFSRHYADDKPSEESAGPRAALYEGQMGRKHRKAARLQNSASGFKGASKASHRFNAQAILSRPKLIVMLAVVLSLVATGAFLYTPARQYYQEMRERDRLQLEIAAVSARNDGLQQEVNSLSTEAGIEDRARSELGWVREGEHAVSVNGVEKASEESRFNANIVSSDIKPPETWYSPLLDPIFGVSS